jgi:hypothetical protein
MKLSPGKAGRIAKTISDVAKSDNKGQALGNAVAGAAIVAHPIVGTMAAPAIRKGTEAAYNKADSFIHDPKVQAKAKSAVQNASKRGRSAIQGLASRAGELAKGVGK